jgi:hypothetical protein
MGARDARICIPTRATGVVRVVFEMCLVIGRGVERPNTTMASLASHFLIGMTA